MAPKPPPAYNADAYNKSRPTYSKEVFDIISKFNDESCFANALDCGCGTGLATRALASFLKIDKIVGIDPSENMISQAEQANGGASNPRYVVGNAEEISKIFGKESFDLITAAQCAHWFDMESFYNAAFTCLQPGGVLAIFSYCHLLVPAYPSIQAEIVKFTEVILSPYWDERRPRLNRLYADQDFLQSPFPKTLRRPAESFHNDLSMVTFSNRFLY
jgi:ubiquinone/menaquinone biosynthesis C-methylase UbiE